MKWLCCFLLILCSLEARGRILICGVCKNIATKLPIVMKTMTECGKAYDDYRIIIYENNSKDGTDAMLRRWMKQDPHVTAITEQLTPKQLLRLCPAGCINRVDIIAMARNRVLQEVMHPKYEDFDFVLMADMDFGERWDIEKIIETTSRTDIDWDGVFANGLLPDGRFYDMFAYRSPSHPFGPEMLGDWWWKNHGWCSISQEAPWQPVYSAFNGLAIYKRNSLKGSKYSGVVTQDLSTATQGWISRAEIDNHPWLQAYRQITHSLPTSFLGQIHNTSARRDFSQEISFVLDDSPQAIVWVHHRHNALLPEVCEHVTLHASMSIRGHGKLFINPALLTHYHE